MRHKADVCAGQTDRASGQLSLRTKKQRGHSHASLTSVEHYASVVSWKRLLTGVSEGLV